MERIRCIWVELGLLPGGAVTANDPERRPTKFLRPESRLGKPVKTNEILCKSKVQNPPSRHITSIVADR